MEVERVHIGRELSALLERVMTMERGREMKGKTAIMSEVIAPMLPPPSSSRSSRL